MIRELGFPNDRIILMLSDDVASNSRNIFPNKVYHKTPFDDNLYLEDIEIDYKGRAVTIETFRNVLIGNHDSATPSSKRMHSTEQSDVLVFLTGHGGENFFKFQDFEEITSKEVAEIFGEMYRRGRYSRLLFFMDTCQASTMLVDLHAPNVTMISSSVHGQSSYSDTPNQILGLPLTDRFAKQLYQFFKENRDLKNKSVQSLIDYFKGYDILSTVSAECKFAQLNEIFLESFFVPKIQSISDWKLDQNGELSVKPEYFKLQYEDFGLDKGSAYLHNFGILLFLIVAAFLALKHKIKFA